MTTVHGLVSCNYFKNFQLLLAFYMFSRVFNHLDGFGGQETNHLEAYLEEETYLTFNVCLGTVGGLDRVCGRILVVSFLPLLLHLVRLLRFVDLDY